MVTATLLSSEPSSPPVWALLRGSREKKASTGSGFFCGEEFVDDFGPAVVTALPLRADLNPSDGHLVRISQKRAACTGVAASSSVLRF